MRRLVLTAILVGGVFYAPLPLIAQKGGEQAPLIPMADIPNDSGGATAPSEVPLQIDPNEAPELVPPQEVNTGGGTSAPAPGATGATPAPAPAPAPVATATPALSPEAAPEPVVAQAEDPDTPVDDNPDETPTDTPTTPEQDEDGTDPEEFEEEFDDGPEAGEPESPAVTVPEATAGPQLPRTGAEIPPIVLSGLSLMAAGMSLRALTRKRV